ncbi:hypothetical protein D3C80_1869970 [compost metagenome]
MPWPKPVRASTSANGSTPASSYVLNTMHFGPAVSEIAAMAMRTGLSNAAAGATSASEAETISIAPSTEDATSAARKIIILITSISAVLPLPTIASGSTSDATTL